MTPTPNLSVELLDSWLRDLAENPVDPEQLDAPVDHPNPEAALQLAPDGLPTWWPSRHPDSQERLTPEARREWCLKYLSGEWSPEQEILRAANGKLRRQMLARCLLLTHLELASGEIPTPDSL